MLLNKDESQEKLLNQSPSDEHGTRGKLFPAGLLTGRRAMPNPVPQTFLLPLKGDKPIKHT